MKRLLIALLLSCSPCYALDKYDDNMASTTGWTDGDSGTTAAWTQETFDSRSCFKYTVVTAGSGKYSSSYYFTPVSGATQSLTVWVYCDSIGTYANVDRFQINWYQQGFVSQIYFASDGLFVYGSSAVEVGTNIVDQDVWTKWTFINKAPTAATAKMDIYKNGVLVGSDVNTAQTGAYVSGRVDLMQRAGTLSGATSYVDSLSVSSYGLQYFENCDSITDWTDADSGTGASTQSSDLGFSSFKLTSGATAGATNFAARRIVPPAMTTCMILEAGVYNDAIGTRANADDAAIGIARTTTAYYQVNFASDGLFKRTAASTYSEVGTDLVTQDALTIWRIKFCTATNKAWITKNGVLVAENIDFGYATTGLTANQITLLQNGTTTTNRLTYFDYVRLYSENGQLIQTIIE